MSSSTSEALAAPRAGIAAEVSLDLPERGLLVVPEQPVGVGVLVLLGSSGRMDLERARLLAQHGAHAVALQWFGGQDQAPGVCEVPLEAFVRAIDRLRSEVAGKLAVVGLSKGAEAAALLACIDDRIDLAVAMSPTSVVWGNVGAGLDGAAVPYRSSWTWQGEPLPFVTYDESWSAAEAQGPVSYRTLYEQSIRLNPVASAAAEIPVEQARGDLVVVAGHDDQLWPSVSFAKSLAERRLSNDCQVEVLLSDDAGHSPRFPGQPPQPPSPRINRGGTAAADAALGASAWGSLVHRLALHGAGTALAPSST